MKSPEKVDTTVGDLIYVLTEQTKQFVGDDRVTYEIVAIMLRDLLAEENRV